MSRLLQNHFVRVICAGRWPGSRLALPGDVMPPSLPLPCSQVKFSPRSHHSGRWPRWLPQQALQLMGPGSPCVGPGDKFGCRQGAPGLGGFPGWELRQAPPR